MNKPVEDFQFEKVKKTASRKDANRLIRAELRSAGQNLAKARPVQNYLYFNEETATNLAAVELKRLGWKVNVELSASDDSWLILATKSLIPDQKLLDKILSL